MRSIDKERIGQDLWPNRRKHLVSKALRARDGVYIHIRIGEAETLARQETEREINKRLKEDHHAGRPFISRD